jgi:hypothetical protein
MRRSGSRRPRAIKHDARIVLRLAKASGVAEWSNKRMTAVLKKRGFRATKTSVMFWLAVKLTRRINDLAIPERDGSSKARRATSRRSK